MIATVPFEALMAYPERVSVGRRDGYPRLRHPTLRGRVVEPHTPKAKGPFQVIKPHVNVAFAEVAVFVTMSRRAPEMKATANFPTLTLRSSTPPP